MRLAQRLKDEQEVMEFVARSIVCDRLFFTVVFASHLANLRIFWGSGNKDVVIRELYMNRADVFLETWEEFVNPVLRAEENEPWAGKWRGGHITNDTE